MQKEQHKNNLIKIREQIPIFYSSMTGTSKQLALDFQQKLSQNNFISSVINIGDVNCQDFQTHQGTIIFFFSTYGSGGPPEDADTFFTWIHQLKQVPNLNLKAIKFMMFALGNCTFQFYCGHGKKIREALLSLGAEQIFQISLSDASSEDNHARIVYQSWYPKALKILTDMYPIKQIEKNTIKKKYKISTKKQKRQNWNWQKDINSDKLSKEFNIYLNSYKADIIHIKQLRQKSYQQRSTIWVRIKKPLQMKLTPACNINIYPYNIIKNQDNDQIIWAQSDNPDCKLPFPQIPLKNLKQLLNFRQPATRKLIKMGILISEASQDIIKKYKQILEQKKERSITMENVINDLKLGVQTYPSLGINNPRPYTLSSWSDEYIDLTISITPHGLASTFLKNQPKSIRIKAIQSSFILKQKQPIIMIANGSGIAPFRSITQYIASLPKQDRNPLFLYYGCQNADDDFYYKSQWQNFQTDKIVTIKLAQSRKDPTNKQYVQNWVVKDKQFFKKHLFEDDGVIFICGGQSMSKSVKGNLFQVCKLKEPMPFKAYKLQNQLYYSNKVIEQVFH